MDEEPPDTPVPASAPVSEVLPAQTPPQPAAQRTQEIDPTRYGDWEKNGRCIDF